MKILKTSLTALAIAATAASASATMTFTQYISGSPLATLDEDSAPYSSSFTKIVQSGGTTLLQTFLANNPSYEIVSAVVEFGFADKTNANGYWKKDVADSTDSEFYGYQARLEYALAEVVGKYLDLGGDQNSNGATEVDGSHSGGYDYHEGEIAEEDFDELEDGVAEFKISAEQTKGEGDFYLKTAKITVTVDSKPSKVPDAGTTATLFGAAMLGLAAVRRKIRR